MGAVAVAVSALWIVLVPQLEWRRDGEYVLLLVTALVAAGACAWGARRLAGRQRAAWTCISVALAVHALGIAGDGSAEALAGQALSSFTLQDLSALLALPFLAVAAVCLLWTHLHLTRLRTILDSVLVCVAAFYVVWLLGMRIIVAPDGSVATSRLHLVTLPLADAAALVVVITVLIQSRAGERLSLSMLAAGIGALTAGDFVAAVFRLADPAVVPQPFDTAWLGAYALIGAGGWLVRPAGAGTEVALSSTDRRRAMIPPLAVSFSAALAAATLALGGTLDRPLLWATSIMVVVLGLRQALVLRENFDLTEGLRRSASELQASELRFRGLVQNSSDVIAVLNRDGVMVYVSQSVKSMLGITAEKLTGTRLADLVHQDDRATFLVHFEDTARRRGGWPAMEFRIQCDNGDWRDIEAIPNNLLDDPGVAGIVLNARDVTDRREMEHTLRHQAFHDPLTGLANRALLRERLEHALARCTRSGESVAVLFIDLDDFKIVNDVHGHAAGDLLLRTVATRIRGALRTMDTPARLGGDEFAVLLEGGVDDHTAAMVAERIIADVSQPVSVADKSITVGTSIGVSIGGANELADNLLRQADVAMYRAKANGKADYAVFHASMDLLSIARLQFEVDLDEALHKRQLIAHYQPIIDLGTGDIQGTEALVRWDHPGRGLLPPSEFIELAEESGQIIDIGREMLRQACQQTQQWRAMMSVSDATVSVNISSRHFRGDELISDVKNVLAETGLPAAALILELTESALLADLRESRRQMAALKKIGVRIALDDFGTGYSSLGYLRELPVDILKIDRSFVVDLGRGDRPSEFIRAITTLARSLELHTVAEGVEQARQVRLLRTLGVDSAQGFHFAKPAAADAIEPLLARRRIATAAGRAEVRVAGGTAVTPRRRAADQAQAQEGQA